MTPEQQTMTEQHAATLAKLADARKVESAAREALVRAIIEVMRLTVEADGNDPRNLDDGIVEE